MSSSIVVITLAVFCVVVVGAGASDSWRPVAHQKTAFPTPSAEETQARSAGDADNRWWLPVSELRSLRSIYVDCISKNDDFGIACMKGKALVLLDRAMGKENIVLGEGVTLERNTAAAEKLITSEEQLEASLPREMGQREKRLDELLFEHIVAFLQSHTVKLNLSSRALQDTFTEARKKGKKQLPYLLFAMLTTGKLVLAYSLKMIALIAGKALIIAKIALVLASVIALKKLVHHEPEHSTHEVIAHEPYHHHYGRSFGGSQDAREDAAHKLAFNMQIPRPALIRTA